MYFVEVMEVEGVLEGLVNRDVVEVVGVDRNFCFFPLAVNAAVKAP